MVGTLTASVAAAVFFRCANRTANYCVGIGVCMVGRRRPGRYRYRRRCRVFFSERTNFRGDFPHIWKNRRRRRMVASIGMLLARLQAYSVDPLPPFGVFLFCGTCSLCRSGYYSFSLFSVGVLVSAFGVGSGPVGFSSRRPRPPCPRNTTQTDQDTASTTPRAND